MIAGQSPGSSNTACASTSSSSSVRPINSSACLSSRPHGRRLTRLPCLFRRHRSRHARRPGAPRLSIVGEGKPFPRVCSSKRTAQKNETHPPERGCVSFFCAACLLVRGGGDEPRDGTLAKRKGVVPRVKKREAQDAARRLARALESTRRGNLCLRRAVESGPSASDASRD